MWKLATYFCYAFIVCNLYGAAQTQDTHSLCVVKDAPNQCGAFCLGALHPLFDHNAKQRQKLDIIADTLIENKAKMEMIESRLQELQVKVLSQLQNTMESQIETRVESFKETGSKETHSVNNDKIILPFFEQIGSRFFYIEKKDFLDWLTAENTCRLKGGHLASIKNEDEFNAISAKLEKNTYYWLGINNRENVKQFVSVASGKPPQYVNWYWGIPNNVFPVECVLIYNHAMHHSACDSERHFICQADHEI
ncbi:accessory gland protein Acp29AB-like [Drosophila elegans]|uniref:accessory gland protein Acp29AB-like n=1 Tax=Drosophila elegans TaxID=30023 RepID=UPI0007E5F7DF|nr:accessory gland protein Acp29AB-like [Drosophila elegans]